LDLHIAIDHFSLKLGPFVPENDDDVYAASKLIPPFVDIPSLDTRDLVNRVSARYSRLAQLPVTDEQRQRAVVGEVAVWLKRGYPPSVLSQVFTSQGRYPLLTKTAKDCLVFAKSQCGDQ